MQGYGYSGPGGGVRQSPETNSSLGQRVNSVERDYLSLDSRLVIVPCPSDYYSNLGYIASSLSREMRDSIYQTSSERLMRAKDWYILRVIGQRPIDHRSEINRERMADWIVHKHRGTGCHHIEKLGVVRKQPNFPISDMSDLRKITNSSRLDMMNEPERGLIVITSSEDVRRIMRISHREEADIYNPGEDLNPMTGFVLKAKPRSGEDGIKTSWVGVPLVKHIVKKS